MRDYQTDVASAWHCARLMADEDFGKKAGVILFTGGGLSYASRHDAAELARMKEKAIRHSRLLVEKLKGL